MCPDFLRAAYSLWCAIPATVTSFFTPFSHSPSFNLVHSVYLLDHSLNLHILRETFPTPKLG